MVKYYCNRCGQEVNSHKDLAELVSKDDITIATELCRKRCLRDLKIFLEPLPSNK